jgi:enediyne biosynthesis protein E4
VPIDPASPAPPSTPEAKVDPNIQIKFTIIFGLLALIPFVLFYFYGLETKKTAPVGGSTNLIPAVRFSDITQAAGIRYSHVNGAAGEKLLPETMGGGCAFFDMDSDGDQDLLFINSSPWPGSSGGTNVTHSLYANDGTGKFADVAAGSGLDFSSYGMGVATGDFDNDGRTDLFFTGVNSTGLPIANRLLRNLGGGKFADVTARSGIVSSNNWSTSAAFLDYDRDGDLDLFVCNYVQWSREIDLQVDYRLPGIGRAYGPPTSFAGTLPALYRNEGEGKFTDVSAAAGVQIRNKATGSPMAKSLGVSPVDLDNDGWIDLVVANDTVQNFAFHNNRNGTFTEMGGRSGLAYDAYGSTRGAMGIDTGRFQDDDTLAISIGNFANEMTAFYVAGRDPLFFSDQAINAGIGAPSRKLLTFGVFFFDCDLNGYLDLLTANGHIEPEIEKVFPEQSYAQPPQLFWNTGRAGKEGSFALVPPGKCGPDLYRPVIGRGSAFADIDNDGDLDVVITQLNGPARLFRNDQKLGHNWVRVKLAGSKSNRDAIGSWVRLRVGNKVFAQQVMPARGYLSQSELPVTIGLGAANRMDDVQIIWPDGTRQSGVPLKINSLNMVTQP